MPVALRHHPGFCVSNHNVGRGSGSFLGSVTWPKPPWSKPDDHWTGMLERHCEGPPLVRALPLQQSTQAAPLQPGVHVLSVLEDLNSPCLP